MPCINIRARVLVRVLPCRVPVSHTAGSKVGAIFRLRRPRGPARRETALENMRVGAAWRWPCMKGGGGQPAGFSREAG